MKVAEHGEKNRVDDDFPNSRAHKRWKVKREYGGFWGEGEGNGETQMTVAINKNSDGWWKIAWHIFLNPSVRLSTGFIFSTGTDLNIGTFTFWTPLLNFNLF